MKKLALILLTLLIHKGSLMAQVSGNVMYNNHGRNTSGTMPIPLHIDPASFTLSVSGLLNVKAATYVATFNITQAGETAESTDQYMRTRISKFMKSIKSIGIDTSAVRIDMLSFVPKYNYVENDKVFSKTFNEVPDGFEMQKNIIVRYKSPAVLDDLVTAAAKAEIYDIVKVDYFISDINKDLETLRNECLALVKKRMKSYEVIGIRLDTMERAFAEQQSTYVPRDMYADYTAFSRPSIDAARKRSILNISSKTKEVEKVVTKYYDPLGYEDFDLVVNPTIDEPVVQLTYRIDVKFSTAKKEKVVVSKEKDSYFIVTPSGEVKKLNL